VTHLTLEKFNAVQIGAGTLRQQILSVLPQRSVTLPHFSQHSNATGHKISNPVLLLLLSIINSK
jgi:hypothetical protein